MKLFNKNDPAKEPKPAPAQSTGQAAESAEGSFDTAIPPQEPEQSETPAKKFSLHKKAKPEKDSETGNAGKKRGLFHKKERIMRVDDLEDIIASMSKGGNVDPDIVVSMYRANRERRRLGAALLRQDKLTLLLLGLITLVMALFIMAFMQEKMGNFTINLNRLELYRKGVSIADDPNFTDATARLKAETVEDATNMSIDDLPDDIDSLAGGNHNGKNYMAYTYYIRNAGKEDLDYVARIHLLSCSKGAEDALRVAVWRNGERTVFAEASADGTPEEGCQNFINHDLVCEYYEENFQVGDVYRYTVVIWMEGDDPECVDSIIGGSVELSMEISSDYEDKSSLLWKFVTDIKDTLFEEKPINAAGNESPTNPKYVGDREVTWATRRNQ